MLLWRKKARPQKNKILGPFLLCLISGKSLVNGGKVCYDIDIFMYNIAGDRFSIGQNADFVYNTSPNLSICC